MFIINREKFVYFFGAIGSNLRARTGNYLLKPISELFSSPLESTPVM
jgi:hypothetical protein